MEKEYVKGKVRVNRREVKMSETDYTFSVNDPDLVSKYKEHLSDLLTVLEMDGLPIWEDILKSSSVILGVEDESLGPNTFRVVQNDDVLTIVVTPMEGNKWDHRLHQFVESFDDEQVDAYWNKK